MDETRKAGKSKLLYKAIEEFAEKGYRGATLRGMAGRMGVTAALVNYHFVSKENLAEEVVKELGRVIVLPKGFSRDSVSTDAEWRAAVKKFITSVIDLFTSSEQPNCFLAPLYRHESCYVSDKKVTLHDICLQPVFDELERMIAMGVPGNDSCSIRLWSLTVWNLLLAYAMKDRARVLQYVPEGVDPAQFKGMTIDFIVDSVMGPLHLQPVDQEA